MKSEEIPSKRDPVWQFFSEIEKMQGQPRSLILVTNGFLELLIESLVRAKCKNQKRILDDNRSYPYSAKLLLLNEAGIVSDKTYKTLEGFRKLRNRAAHEPFFELTEKDFVFIQNEELRKPGNLRTLCINIMAELWNAHTAIFFPTFAPITSQTRIT